MISYSYLYVDPSSLVQHKRSKQKKIMAQSLGLMLFLSSVITLAALHGTRAVDYTVTNDAGSVRFTNDIGIDYTKQTMMKASDFIWQTFQQNNEADRRNFQEVSLSIDNIDNKNVAAVTSNNEIRVSASYIENYSGDVKTEITGVIYHEMTHVWQSNGSGQAPGGLIEGIADYVRLKAGLAPSHWVQPGQGDKWDHGYDVTARFLDYCDSLKNGFVAELNTKMKSGYSDNFFVDILGKTVDQLWSDYKAKYAT